MSLIYARKLDGMVFFLSDTSSQIGLTNAKIDWYLDPLVKIVEIHGNWIIAYAGNSFIAEKILNELETDAKLDPISHLFSEHLKHQKSEYKSVEFAVCNASELSLTFIKGGEKTEVSAGYLGSPTGFNLLQSEFHKPAQNSVPHTIIGFRPVIEGIPEDSYSKYNAYLDAFKRITTSTDGTFGGIVVPFIITTNERCYGSYMEIIRGPLQESESNIPGWNTVAFQDPTWGGMQLLFSGGETGFSIHFPDGQCGCIYSGFTASKKISCKAHRNIDPYDFVHIAKSQGITNIGSTWTSNHSDFEKSHQLISAKLYNRAEELIKSVEERLNKSLANKNDGREFIFSSSLLSTLKNKPLLITIEEIIVIQNLINLRGRLANTTGNKPVEEKMNAEKQIIDKLVNESQFSVTIEYLENFN